MNFQASIITGQYNNAHEEGILIYDAQVGLQNDLSHKNCIQFNVKRLRRIKKFIMVNLYIKFD